MIRHLFLFLLVALSCRAALEKDLGQDLHYVRIRELTGELPALRSALAHERAIVDLRYAKVSAEAAAELSAALQQTAAAPTRLQIFLINDQTDAAIASAIGKERARRLTVGRAAPGVTVDISVRTSAEEERKAYDALESGTPVEKLISSNAEKRRFDEAALARTHATGVANITNAETLPPTPGAAVEADPSDEAVASAAPPPAIPPDLVLQKAVHLHHALRGRSP